MLGKFLNGNSLLLLLGAPLLLLLFAFLVSGRTSKDSFENEYNPYLKKLPNKYLNALQLAKVNDSTFFAYAEETYTSREILVFKFFPSTIELATDFKIEVYPLNKKDPLSFDLSTNGVLYNFHGNTYGVFRKALPRIDMEKLIVKQKTPTKKQTAWSDTINKPFKPLDKILEFSQSSNKGFQTAPNAFASLFTETLNRYDISFLPASYKVINDSLYKVYKNLNNYISEENQTIATIEKVSAFWGLINNKDQKFLQYIRFQGSQKDVANAILEEYINEEREVESTIDLKKLSKFLALKNTFTNDCSDPIYLIYNESSNLIEPFFANSACLGAMSNYLRKSKIIDVNYLKIYAQSLKEVSQLDIFGGLIDETSTLQEELNLINKYNPQYVFDEDILAINQRIIAKSLNPSFALKTELISIDSQKMIVSILNMSSYPIDIRELNHETKKTISTLNPRKQILSGQQDTLVIELSRSFENLFVSKKKKVTGFLVNKHIGELFIGYSISGIDDIQFSTIIPYQAKESLTHYDLFRIKSTLEQHKALVLNEQEKMVTMTSKSITVATPLIIPKGYTFAIKHGATIDIVEGGKIISYSPLDFEGTQEKQIKFFSSDKKGQGLLVLSDGAESNLKFVRFEDLTNPRHGSWSVTGAVTFYESPVNLTNVVISNNRCEDALNIIRTTFFMKYCNIKNTQSDAFDGDFVEGRIVGTLFDNLGNDAVDVSGSDIEVINVRISNAGDKGLSAGEDSKMTVNNVEISESEIGVAGKDLSIVKIKNLEINNTKLGFTAFQKKAEFGPSNITVEGLEMDGVETNYLIESSSSLFVDGEKIETAQNVKDRMYGVEFGRSSEETRNSQ